MAMKDNKALAAFLAVLAIAVVGYVVYGYLNPPMVKQDVKCEKCEKGWNAQLSPKAAFPVDCPTCKTKTAFKALKLQCVKCQIKDIYVVEKEDGKGMGEKCKKCGELLLP